MKWRPLLYRSPSRQPRQAVAPAQYSNLKCVSRLRATLYMHFKLLVPMTIIVYLWNGSDSFVVPFIPFNVLYVPDNGHMVGRNT